MFEVQRLAKLFAGVGIPELNGLLAACCRRNRLSGLKVKLVPPANPIMGSPIGCAESAFQSLDSVLLPERRILPSGLNISAGHRYHASTRSRSDGLSRRPRAAPSVVAPGADGLAIRAECHNVHGPLVQ